MPSKLDKLKAVLNYAVEQGEIIPQDLLLEIAKEEARQILEDLHLKDGIDGPKGDKGDRGPKGDKGDRGNPGPQGDKGDPGKDGEPGKQGKQGERGYKGEDGKSFVAIGPTGPAGAPGAPGAPGTTDHAALSHLTYADAGHTGFAPALGSDDNYVTDAEKAALHPAVTLDVNADTLLSLSTQAFGLDTQTANRVLAGPTTGVPAIPTFRALVAGDVPALPYSPAVIVTDKAAILALTPTSGLVAFATTISSTNPTWVGRWYVANGTSWYQIVPNSAVADSPLPDMGAYEDSARTGYGDTYITDKSLNYVTLGAGANSVTGAMRLTASAVGPPVVPSYFQIYANGVWNNIVINFQFREVGGVLEHIPVGYLEWIEVDSGNSEVLALNGLPMIQQYTTSMGAYPLPLILDGGAF